MTFTLMEFTRGLAVFRFPTVALDFLTIKDFSRLFGLMIFRNRI